MTSIIFTLLLVALMALAQAQEAAFLAAGGVSLSVHGYRPYSSHHTVLTFKWI